MTPSPATLTLTDGETLAPGDSTGILKTGDLTFGSGSTLQIEIEGTTPGPGPGGFDQVQVTGTVDIQSGAVLEVSRPTGFVPSFGQDFTILVNDGGDAITGTFQDPGGTMLADGGIFELASRLFRIDMDGGDGNDLVLTDQTRPISTPDIATITEADAGSQLTVAADFNLAMDTGITPTITFPTPGEDATPTLTLDPGASGWRAGGEIFDAVFDIADVDQELANIDIRFDGVQDANGDPIPVVTSNDVFSIDTQAPSIDPGGSTPANGATDVSLDTDLDLAFSEDIQLGNGDIAIFRVSDPTAVATIDATAPGGALSVSGTTLTLDPSGDLPGPAEIFVKIDAGPPSQRERKIHPFKRIDTQVQSHARVGRQPPVAGDTFHGRYLLGAL